ncbi:MAG: crossover junction endodeoxyribonuclease RuvC [Leptospiraceae bacterium]|nr:crossover junction endodeoxyribonuclease RuvC [Leptospiraceae bacterium]
MSLRILGIDPGTHRVGYAILEKSNVSRIPKLIEYGTIESKSNTNALDALVSLRESLLVIIERTSPTHASVEELFFSKNTKTAGRVFQARGVILLTLAEKKLKILEPTVTQIKKGITGSGTADKKQIGVALKLILGLDELKGHDDSWDAIACGFVGLAMI